MNKSEIALLNKLLKKLLSSDLIPPNMPRETWRNIQNIVPMPAVELLITSNNRDVFLTERHDEDWDGWHIPGGFIIAGDSLDDACNRISQRELNTKVKLLKVLNAVAWTDHPFGYPISILCYCDYEKTPSGGKFFKALPDNMVHQNHRVFIKTFFNYLKSNEKKVL